VHGGGLRRSPSSGRALRGAVGLARVSASVNLRPFNVKSKRAAFNQTKRAGMPYLSMQGERMQYSREDFETLRLLRAFGKIQDAEKRRQIIKLVERKAGTSNENPDDEQSVPPN
jgi:hypothetical protein